jgi:hypothetical protein
MRELTRRQSNQSKKVVIVNSYYQWQILKAQWKKGRKRGASQFPSKLREEQRRTLSSKVVREWLVSVVT